MLLDDLVVCRSSNPIKTMRLSALADYKAGSAICNILGNRWAVTVGLRAAGRVSIAFGIGVHLCHESMAIPAMSM